MAREIFVTRSRLAPALAPAGEHAERVIEELPVGAVLRVKIDRPRNAKLHRLYWELCRRVADLMRAAGSDESAKTVDARFKVAAGLCVYQRASPAVQRATGVTHIAVPGSISFAAMDDDEFRAFFRTCERLVLTELLPRMPRSEWRDRIADLLLDGKEAA